MYYIFNSSGTLVSTSSHEPDTEDLSSRGEYFSKNISGYDLDSNRVVGGKFGGVYEAVCTPEEEIEKTKTLKINQRNKQLTKTDWIVIRHNEQVLLGNNTNLSDIEYKEVLKYRQELRDFPTQLAFPNIDLPQKPVFLE